MDFELKNDLLRLTLFKERLRLIEKSRVYYEDEWDSSSILEYQISKFNQVWGRCFTNIPFYKKWKKENSLPEKIEKIEDLRSFPRLRKIDLQTNSPLILETKGWDKLVSTGGSEGTPVQVPMAKNQCLIDYSDHYVARSWWGVKPLDKIVLFWGHSHLFGTGLKGRVAHFRRKLKDLVINTVRVSAYLSDSESLSCALQVITAERPVLIIGYTSFLYKLAVHIESNKLSLNTSALKGVIVTAELISGSDAALIERAFRAPVIKEYGMAEAGVIACSRPKDGRYQFFWRTFFCYQDEGNELVLSTLDDRVFPLINYATGDLLEGCNDLNNSLITCSSVLGRVKDVLNVAMRNGVGSITAIFFVHSLKNIEGVVEVQCRQTEGNTVAVEYTALTGVDHKKVRRLFFKSVLFESPEILPQALTLRCVNQIQRTIAGKLAAVA